MNPNVNDPLTQYDSEGSQKDTKELNNSLPPVDWQSLITKKFQMGWDDVASSRHAVDLMNSNVDDATELTHLEQGPGKPGTDLLQAEYAAQPWHIRAVADAAGTLPALGDTLVQGAVGGGLAAGTVGGGTAVATGGNIPAALSAGATAYGYGATTGELHSIWEQSAGQMYKDLRLKGVTRGTAKNLSYVFGGINAGIGMIGLKAITGVAGKAMSVAQRDAIKSTLNTPFVKSVEGTMYGRLGMTYAEHVAQGTAAGTGMAINDQLSKVVAGYIEKQKGDAYTNWDTATHSVADGMLQALGASAVLAAGGTALGAASGHASGVLKGGAKKALENANVEALNNLKDKSPQEILAQLQEGLKNQPNPWENPGEFHQVTYDDNGNPIIKITTTKEQSAQRLEMNGTNTEVTLYRGVNDKVNVSQGKDAPGYFYSPDRKVAEVYAGKEGSVKEQKLSFSNLLESKNWMDAKAKLGLDSSHDMTALIIKAKEQGYDGIHFSKTTWGEEYIHIPTDKEVATSRGANGQMSLTDIAKNAQVTADKLNIPVSKEDIRDGLNALYPDQFERFNSPNEEATQTRLPLVESRPLNAEETQARLNQLSSDKTLLKRESNRLEAEINRQEQTGQSSFKNIDKWQKVNQTIDALNSEREILESGLGRSDEQGPNWGKVRIKKLNKIFDKITAQAEELRNQKADGTAKEEKAYKAGAFKTQRAISKIQQDLKQVVRAVTNKSGKGYTKEERAQITALDAKIAGVTTPGKAESVIREIKAHALKMEEQRANSVELEARRKVYNQVVKLIENRTIRIQNGHPVSVMPPEVTVKLQILRGLLKDESALKVAEYDFEVQHGKTPIDQLTPEDIDGLRILQMARSLHSGDALSRNVAAGTIAQWVLDGKNTIAKQRASLEAEKAQHVQDALSSLGATEKSKINLTPDSAQRVKHFYNDIQAGEWTWNTLLDRLSAKDPNHKLTAMLDDTQPRGEYLANKEIATQNFMGFLRDKVPTEQKGNILQRIADTGRDKYAVQYTTAEGKELTVTLTKAQMMDAELKYRDVTLHEALKEGNKFTLPGEVEAGTSFIERVQSKFDDTDRALIDGILEFYPDYHTSINAKYKEVHNVDLPQRENYTPVSRKGYQVDPPFSKDGLQFWSLLPGSAKTRQDSKLPIQLKNPFQTALQHIDQWEYWKAYTDKLRAINNVITDRGVRDWINQEHGSGTMHVMDNFVERFMKNDALPSEPSDSFWSAMQADIAHHALGFKPVTGFLTQLSSGLNYWADYHPGELALGIAKTVLHPIETEKSLRSSAILKHRYKEGAGVAMERAMHQGGLFGAAISKLTGHEPEVMDINRYDALNRFIFAGYMQGDAATSRLFGAPVYWAERSKGKSASEAMQTVERIAEQTQQSSAVSQVPYNGQNNTVNTFVRMFTQQPIQSVGKVGTFMNDFANSKHTPGDWMKLGWRMGMIWFAPGAMMGAIRSAPSWLFPPSDDGEEADKRKRETVHNIVGSSLLGPLAGLPIFGDIAQGIWFMAAKPLIGVDESARTDYFSSNPLMETLFNNPKEMFKRWSSLNKEEDIFKAINLNDTDKQGDKQNKFNASAAKTVTALLGVPKQSFDIPSTVLDRAAQGDTVGAALSIGGWSPGSIKQRKEAPQNLFPSLDLNTSESTSAYDTIQTMLDQIVKKDVKGKKFGESQSTSKEEMDALIKGISDGKP